MSAKWNDTVVVGTGATSGIGRATAIAFARKSFHLVLAARSEPVLDDLAGSCRELGPDAVTVTADARVEEYMARDAQTALDSVGRSTDRRHSSRARREPDGLRERCPCSVADLPRPVRPRTDQCRDPAPIIRTPDRTSCPSTPFGPSAWCFVSSWPPKACEGSASRRCSLPRSTHRCSSMRPTTVGVRYVHYRRCTRRNGSRKRSSAVGGDHDARSLSERPDESPSCGRA